MFDHTQILGVKNIGSSFIFKDRHIFPGPCLLHDGVFPSAGMGAGSLVGISSHQVIAEKTSSGIGNAHCPMDKSLDFHILRNVSTDFPDFLKGKLSGSHHALCTKLVPEAIGFIIGVICLGTDMALDFRTDFPGIRENPRICNDQCVRLQILQFFQIFLHSRQIIVMCQDIHGHINLHSMLMGKGNSRLHVLMGKILGFCTQSKGLSPDIHSIGPEHNRDFQYLQAAGRDQQFRFFHDDQFPLFSRSQSLRLPMAGLKFPEADDALIHTDTPASFYIWCGCGAPRYNGTQ